MGWGNGPWLARKTRVEGLPCGPFPTSCATSLPTATSTAAASSRTAAPPNDVLQMQIDQIGDQLQDVLHGVDNAPALDRR